MAVNAVSEGQTGQKKVTFSVSSVRFALLTYVLCYSIINYAAFRSLISKMFLCFSPVEYRRVLLVKVYMTDFLYLPDRI